MKVDNFVSFATITFFKLIIVSFATIDFQLIIVRKVEKQPEPLGKYLSVAYKAFFSLVEEKLKEFEIGIGAEELHLLLPLYRKGTLPQKRLCEIFHQDKATIARRLKRLENENFIRREEDPEDRRRKLVHLTGKSMSKRPIFREFLTSIDEHIRTELSQKEIERFLQSMKKICQILRKREEQR